MARNNVIIPISCFIGSNASLKRKERVSIADGVRSGITSQSQVWLDLSRRSTMFPTKRWKLKPITCIYQMLLAKFMERLLGNERIIVT